MANILKLILIIFLVGIIGVVGVLGYFGILPGLSNLMGTNKPRDLGMVYSQEKFESALKKSNVQMKTLEQNAPLPIAYEGSHEVKANFSDEELTSHAFNKDWINYPISDVQVRINDDNTCEVSGMIDLTKVGGLLEALNISEGDYQQALAEANIPMKKLPFYAKGAGTVTNNNMDAAITAFEVGRFPIPKNLIEKYSPAAMQFGETIMKRIPGFYANEARFENGSIYFDGKLPNAELTKRLSQ